MIPPSSEVVHRRSEAPMVVGAFLAVGLMFQGDSGWRLVALVGGLAALTVGAVRVGSAPALRAVLFADLVVACVYSRLFGLWPLPAVVALAVVAVAGRWVPALAPLTRSIRWGRATPELPWLMALTVVVSAGALAGWALLYDPKLPSGYLDTLERTPPWALPLLALGFALVNAAAEEGLFSGVLQTELSSLWNAAPAVAVQGVCFGLFHLSGFPRGALGAVMAGSWGTVLAIMRIRTGGIGASYLTHVCADVTIVTLSYLLLRR